MLGGLVTPAWCASYLEPMYLTVDYRSYGRDLCVCSGAWILDSMAVSLGKITDTCSSEALILSLYRRHIECCLHTTG